MVSPNCYRLVLLMMLGVHLTNGGCMYVSCPIWLIRNNNLYACINFNICAILVVTFICLWRMSLITNIEIYDMVAMCEVTVGMKFIGNNARNRKKDRFYQTLFQILETLLTADNDMLKESKS